MNILILSWRGLGHPNAGGAEISTHEHAKDWVGAGHDVTLFTSYYEGAKREQIIDGVRIIRQGSQVFGVHWEAFVWYLFSSHQKYDLVVDQFHGVPFFTPLYVKIKKLAFIHEVTKEVWKFNHWPKPFNLIPMIFGILFEPLIFKFLYSRIPFMTVSESTKKDLVAWGIPQKNITVVYNGIHRPSFKKKPSKEKTKTIIFLGALSKDKGIEDALLTFLELQKITHVAFQYWVVGKGELTYLKILRNKVSHLGLKNIKFWGYVSEEKKFELLSRAHILVNPSIREGWGLTVIEAAAVGTPTIAYNVPGLKDSIINEKTGILCESNNPENLASNILKLLNNKKEFERIKKNAESWSKNFSWKKSSDMSLRLIQSLVEKDSLQK